MRLHASCLDAGHCCQNVYLYCASEGLKCCERGGANFEELFKLMGLDNTFKGITTMSVGY